MRRTFNVISVIENDIDFDDLTLTQHWSKTEDDKEHQNKGYNKW